MESTKTRGPQQGAALMKRTTKYVALDVHQATTVASVREESGSGSRTGRTEFDSNQEILSQLLTLLLSVSAWPSRPLRVACSLSFFGPELSGAVSHVPLNEVVVADR